MTGRPFKQSPECKLIDTLVNLHLDKADTSLLIGSIQELTENISIKEEIKVNKYIFFRISFLNLT